MTRPIRRAVVVAGMSASVVVAMHAGGMPWPMALAVVACVMASIALVVVAIDWAEKEDRS
jgi:hypothetical protein